MAVPSDELAGMTVNERLFSLKLLADFDQAVTARNRNAMISILQLAKIAEQDAVAIVDAVLGNPARYGF